MTIGNSRRFVVACASLALLAGCTGQHSTTSFVKSNKSKAWSNSLTKSPSSSADPANDPTKLNTAHKPLDSKLYLKSARMLEQRGNLPEAEAHYERAVQLAPRKPELLVALARFYDRRSKYDQATSLYQRAVKLAPNASSTYNDLALCLSRAGKNEEGLVALKRAIQLKPQKVLYRNNIATILVSMKRVDEALAQLNAVHPPAVAHYNVGFLLTKQGHPEVARRYLQRALQLDGSLTAAQLVLDKLPRQQQQGYAESQQRVQAYPASQSRPEDNEIQYLPPVR